MECHDIMYEHMHISFYGAHESETPANHQTPHSSVQHVLDVGGQIVPVLNGRADQQLHYWL